jgi:hypothetical protein
MIACLFNTNTVHVHVHCDVQLLFFRSEKQAAARFGSLHHNRMADSKHHRSKRVLDTFMYSNKKKQKN